MTVTKATDVFEQVAGSPLTWLRHWKETNQGKVIGCLPMYVPEEIIAAAGVLPATLPGSDRRIVQANAYLHSNLCHPVRGNFESALSGELDFLDGLIFADICDQTKRIGNLWEIYHHPVFSFHLRIPKRIDTREALSFYTTELRRFQSAVESFTGRKITESGLKKTIAGYNQVRQLFSRLYELRWKNPASFRASEVDSIITAAMVMPKDQVKTELSRYLNNKQLVSETSRQPAVLVCANPCEDMEPGLLNMISEVGGLVVDDYVYSGAMYQSTPVSEEGDPIVALAGAYLDSPPCSTKHDLAKDWGEYILKLARQAKVDGVIFLMPKYCEIYGFDYPDTDARLNQAGMPHLMLELEHAGADGRIRTRLEAFIEMLRAIK